MVQGQGHGMEDGVEERHVDCGHLQGEGEKYSSQQQKYCRRSPLEEWGSLASFSTMTMSRSSNEK